MKSTYRMTVKALRAGAVLAIGLALAGCGDNLTVADDHQPYQPASLEPLDCVPDLDGQIEADELAPAFGVSVSYLVSPDGEQRPVDLVGRVGDDGRRLWDWGADYASDQVARLSASRPGGKWYAGSFPQATFVAPFDAAGSIEAVYAHDEQAVRLLGLASAVEQPPEGRTLMVYDQPVEVYRFPLRPGDAWVAVGEVRDGLLRGLPYAARDTYEIAVDGAGELVLPDLTFSQVLRVRSRTVIEPAVGQSVAQRQVSFLFECFGEVARATSQLDEPAEDFTSALQVRRLGI